MHTIIKHNNVNPRNHWPDKKKEILLLVSQIIQLFVRFPVGNSRRKLSINFFYISNKKARIYYFIQRLIL